MVVSRQLLAGNYDGARRSALPFIDIFSKDRYFIEIQDHGVYEQKRSSTVTLFRLQTSLDSRLWQQMTFTMLRERMLEYQDVLMCIQMGKTVDDNNRMKMNTDQLYLKSKEEMDELHIPEALENTAKIAEQCNVEIEFGKLHLPKFVLPEGTTSYEYLKKLVLDGLSERYPNDDGTARRAEYELETINLMGYVDYFLIVWEFQGYAKNGIMIGRKRKCGGQCCFVLPAHHQC